MILLSNLQGSLATFASIVVVEFQITKCLTDPLVHRKMIRSPGTTAIDSSNLCLVFGNWLKIWIVYGQLYTKGLFSKYKKNESVTVEQPIWSYLSFSDNYPWAEWLSLIGVLYNSWRNALLWVLTNNSWRKCCFGLCEFRSRVKAYDRCCYNGELGPVWLEVNGVVHA